MKRILDAVVSLCGLIPFFLGVELLNPLYPYLFLAAILYSFLIGAKKVPQPPKLFINVTAVLLLLSVLVQVRYDYIVEAFMEAILVMAGVKMLEDKKWRDYGELLLLFFMLLSAYAMLSNQKLFVVYSLGILILGSFAQMLASSLERDPNVLFSNRELTQLFKSALRIIFMMLPIATLLFVIAPRSSYTAHRLQSSMSRTNTVGFSDQVRLGDVSSIQRSNAVVFRAEMKEIAPMQLYWRGMVMDTYLGDVWTASQLQRFPNSFKVEGERLEQSIYMEPGYHRYYFALDLPINIMGVDFELHRSGVFRNTDALVNKRRHYTAVSTLTSGLYGSMEEREKEHYLALPSDFSPKIRALTEKITVGMSPREKVEAIMDFLSPPNFSYTLDSLPVGQNALEDFVMTSRQGNCEYFASAMGVMLRMVGVPTRLVAGYMGGVYNEAGGYYIVTQSGAHVWVEVWDQQRQAWVRHDPTPPGSVGQESESQQISQLGLYWDLMDYHWTRLVVNYDLERQTAIMDALKKAIRNPRGSVFSLEFLSVAKKALTERSRFLLALAMFLLCGIGYSLYKKRKSVEQRLIRRFQKVMARHGFSMQAGQGLVEFAESLPSGSLKEEVLIFAYDFSKAYYTDKPFDRALCDHLQSQLMKIKLIKE